MTDADQLKLSRIYRSCINDIEDILGIAILGAEEQRIVQVLSDAVDAAVSIAKCDKLPSHEDGNSHPTG